MEIDTWSSHSLSTLVVAILAQELLGYEVSFFQASGSAEMTQRMSSVGTGICSPTHVNVEVWLDAATQRALAVYYNESSFVGSVGYDGLAGLFTSTTFIKAGLSASPAFSADFWRDYRDKDALIHELRASVLFNNAAHYPPKESGCADGVLGCRDSCSKSKTCTKREGNGGECLVVIMMDASYDVGYLQASLSNNDIPAYFCFLGISGAAKYVSEALASTTPVAFYNYQPDEFFQRHIGQVERVALPWATPERTALNTGNFGENGYGEATDNPVRVDFPRVLLGKYLVKVLTSSDGGMASLMNMLTIQEKDMDSLLSGYNDIRDAGVLSQTESYFTAACNWLRKPENYQIWSEWLEPLPDCEYDTHYSFALEGCDSNTNEERAFPRRAKFYWKSPRPDNISLPYTCDPYHLPNSGLPDTLVTSRSCSWLVENTNTWLIWASLGTQPICDTSFYTHDVSECTSSGQREVTFRWLLPDAKNTTFSSECTDGKALPDPVLIDCEYVPYSTAASKVVFGLACLFTCVMLGCIGFVVYEREQPIVKRSQYQFLVTMLLGGVLMCYATVIYSGAPSRVVCALRPTLISWAFTLIFGSLVVKSMRVYRVFLSSAMKRVVLAAGTMMKVLAGFLIVDIVILVLWELVSPSDAVVKAEAVAEIGGLAVDRVRCASSSSVFVGLLFFWKAVMLFGGLYLSILIRKVSSDFQESVWIFASACVVLFSSLLLLPMGYFVTLSAIAFFLFFSFIVLSATMLVIGLMLVPKMLRLHDLATSGASEMSKTTREKQTASSSSEDDAQVAPLRSGASGGSRTSKNSKNSKTSNNRKSSKSNKGGKSGKKDAIRVSLRVPATILKASASVSALNSTQVTRFSTTSMGPRPPWRWKKPDDTTSRAEKLAAHLKVEPTAVLGHSFGGKVALTYLQQCMQHARAPPSQVWVLDSLPGTGTRDVLVIPLPIRAKAQLIKDLQGHGVALGEAQWLTTNLRLTSKSPELYEWKMDVDVIEQLFRSFLGSDLWPVVENPPATEGKDVEIHFVHASKNNMWTSELLDRLDAQQENQVYHHLLEKSGHWTPAGSSLFPATVCSVTDGTANGDFIETTLLYLFGSSPYVVVERYNPGQSCDSAGLKEIAAFLADGLCHKTGWTSSYTATRAADGSVMIATYETKLDCIGAITSTLDVTAAQALGQSCAADGTGVADTKIYGTGVTPLYLKASVSFDTTDALGQSCTADANGILDRKIYGNGETPLHLTSMVSYETTWLQVSGGANSRVTTIATDTCVATSTCTGSTAPYSSVICSTTSNYKMDMAAMFGSNPYIIVERYTAGQTAVRNLASIKTFLADSSRAGSANSCANDANGILDTKVYFSEVYLLSTVTYESGVGGCKAPVVPTQLFTTVATEGSCEASSACIGTAPPYNGTLCSSTSNYQNDVAAAFGPSPYVIVEKYTAGKSCDMGELSSIQSYIADTKCHRTSSTTSFRAIRKTDGSSTIMTYANSGSCRLVPKTFAVTTDQAIGNSCSQGSTGVVDTKLYGGGAMPLFLTVTAVYDNTKTSNCMAPAIPMQWVATTLSVDDCVPTVGCQYSGPLYTSTVCSNTKTYQQDVAAAFGWNQYVLEKLCSVSTSESCNPFKKILKRRHRSSWTIMFMLFSLLLLLIASVSSARSPPQLPHQFQAEVQVLSHLTDPRQEYPPSIGRMKVQYDFDQQLARPRCWKDTTQGKPSCDVMTSSCGTAKRVKLHNSRWIRAE
ncbi:Alpha/Beta hydrolase fold [Phytophthora cactorum]|nr:Alpha/Beta hydrolase fold [Phytophthora cactorum]